MNNFLIYFIMNMYGYVGNKMVANTRVVGAGTRDSVDIDRLASNPILLNQRISAFKDYANIQKYGTFYEDREALRSTMRSEMKKHSHGSISPKLITGGRNSSLKSKSVM